jgi:hypothetical protein
MRVLRSSLLVALLTGASTVGISLAIFGALAVLVPGDAQASVSIAVGYDALVKDADAVGVVTPVESKTVWEEGRIVTYTRVKVDQGVAGDLGTGSEGWVRTLGGVVGKIGQLVDGEPVFTAQKPSLLFLRRWKSGGTWEVSARAQGQFPILVVSTGDTANAVAQRRVMRSTAVGMLLPPRPASTVAIGPAPVKTDPNGAADRVAQVRLAGEVLHDRPLDEVTRDVAASWKTLHPATPSTK